MPKAKEAQNPASQKKASPPVGGYIVLGLIAMALAYWGVTSWKESRPVSYGWPELQKPVDPDRYESFPMADFNIDRG